MTEEIPLSLSELVTLAAVDFSVYSRTFFEKTFRQISPDIHHDVWDALEDPSHRQVNILAFRGSAKTTLLRTFTSKRIAYGISRTILYLGASERDAVRSIQWLRNQVERNKKWSQTFNLHKGMKWQETEIEIINETLGLTTWVIGAGMSSSIRGINFDDYRPDLIVIDDPLTDENALTHEQREKISNLILGAVRNSLAPATEEPNAKIAMLATPQHPEDATSQARKSPLWHTLIFPCWTKETMDLETSKQVSVWEERLPSETLRKEKLGALQENKLSIFLREMECRLTSVESVTFRPEWINRYDYAPEGLFTVLSIDPVPPPSEREINKGLIGKDYEAQEVWGRGPNGYYLLDCEYHKGHDPNWTLATAFALARKHRVARIIIESVAYQRVLVWLFKQYMERTQQWYSIVPYVDTRSKYTRITTTLSGLASAGKIFVGPTHAEFIAQFQEYPGGAHDDLLDAAAIALSDIANPMLEAGTVRSELDLTPLPFFRRCP